MKGRPFEPGNHLGRGRPRGSRNKRSLIAKQLLDDHSEDIVQKALVMALKGDVGLLRTLLSYILPHPKDLPCETGPLPMATLEEISQTSEATLKRVASGKITLSEAGKIFDLIEGCRRVIATEELEDRVNALELSHKINTPPASKVGDLEEKEQLIGKGDGYPNIRVSFVGANGKPLDGDAGKE